jgi:hypothetical protein
MRRHLLVAMLISIRENEGDNCIGLDPHPACSREWGAIMGWSEIDVRTGTIPFHNKSLY